MLLPGAIAPLSHFLKLDSTRKSARAVTRQNSRPARISARAGRPKNPGIIPLLVLIIPTDINTPVSVSLKKGFPMRRHKMSAKASRRDFGRKASRSHKKNYTNPMRGGIRA
ncbi:MAG: hypothetical protein [Microvirus sp.]|nr:MAG: hypothetical protein [Microvirus sp.]